MDPVEYRKRYKESIKNSPVPSCHKKYKQNKEVYSKYYQENKDRINENSRQRRSDFKVQILDSIKHRSKKRGEICNLELEDIIIPEYCPVFPWIKLEKTKTKNTTPSADRMDSLLGYTKENTTIMSTRANILKRDATLEELIALGKWAEKVRKEYENK